MPCSRKSETKQKTSKNLRRLIAQSTFLSHNDHLEVIESGWVITAIQNFNL